MKCNRYAIYGWKSSTGLKRNPDKPIVLGSVKSIEDLNLYTKHSHLFSHLEVCDGQIESQIELEFIPYMGGSDANIEVRFVCNKCKYNHAGENGLPSDIDLVNRFLTKLIKEM
jgi:hypothetical protein